MMKLRLIHFTLPSLMLAFCALATAEAALPTFVKGQAVASLAPLVEEASPAVVNIRVSQTLTRRNPFGVAFSGFPMHRVDNRKLRAPARA